MNIKLTEKGRALIDVLGYHTGSVEPGEIVELENRGLSAGYLIAAGIYEEDTNDEGEKYLLAADGPNIDVLGMIDVFYAHSAEVLSEDIISRDLHAEEGFELTDEYVTRAIWTGLFEYVTEQPKQRKVRDTRTGATYSSKSEAGKALAAEYGVDPQDRFAWYTIIKADPSRLEEV